MARFPGDKRKKRLRQYRNRERRRFAKSSGDPYRWFQWACKVQTRHLRNQINAAIYGVTEQ